MQREAGIYPVGGGAGRSARQLPWRCWSERTSATDGTGDDGTGVGTVEFRAVLTDERGWPEMTSRSSTEAWTMDCCLVSSPTRASSGWPEEEARRSANWPRRRERAGDRAVDAFEVGGGGGDERAV